MIISKETNKKFRTILAFKESIIDKTYRPPKDLENLSEKELARRTIAEIDELISCWEENNQVLKN